MLEGGSADPPSRTPHPHYIPLFAQKCFGADLATIDQHMHQSIVLGEWLSRGVALEPHEAVAVAQLVIAAAGRGPVEPPFGPPTLENVVLAVDGAVSCPHCGATPAVSEIGRLLAAMLPPKIAVRVPGGLRYTIARALTEVDAPPFDSIAALSIVLERYERGDRNQAVRGIVSRTPAVRLVPAVPPPEAIAPAAAPRLSWFAIGAVAASVSFSASYVAVAHYWIRHPRLPNAAIVALPPGHTLAADDLVAPATRPVEPAPRTIPRPAAADGRAADAVPATPRDAGPMFPPAFASNGTAIFSRPGQSPDARNALAERSIGDDFAVMTILDDGARNYHVQPSPDESRIAFDSDREGERAVYVANRDGSNVHRVSGPGYGAVPTWSPDGRQLAFIRSESDRPHVWNLWLTTLETGDMRRLTQFKSGQTWGASWFPDGGAVAYTHEDQLLVMHLGDGLTHAFRSPVAGRLVRTAAVAPDGRHVIFQVARSGAWLVDLSDGSMRCALTDPTAEEFAWAPDGRRVAYRSRRDGRWGIWLMTPPA
jgi:WD40-like Beta Propeller Repeat